MVILGFDPGGDQSFGWCVAEKKSDNRLWLREAGVEHHAEGAVNAALKHAAKYGPIEAAGIDGPLFWIANGDRKADRRIRDGMKLKGFEARKTGGTVQHVNSLRGACVVQGIMAARLLRRRLPNIRITETHPKALLWLKGIANQNRPSAEIRWEQIFQLIAWEQRPSGNKEHERDAALGAVAALAMLEKSRDWHDLFQEEEDPFAPVTPIEYWMPIPPM